MSADDFSEQSANSIHDTLAEGSVGDGPHVENPNTWQDELGSEEEGSVNKIEWRKPTLRNRGSDIRKWADSQDFYKLRDECLAEGRLWEDPEFEATDSSIFYEEKPKHPIEWKRPGEIAGRGKRLPCFFVDGASRFDINQGGLGDCWLVAVIDNLTLRPTLYRRVVPEDQSFDQNYAGIFHFRFWRYGRWEDVVVDDRLPTCYGKLYYLHSNQANEFWCALLEKAYAKIHGSYEALEGGLMDESMLDFTGGICEKFVLQEPPANLFQMLLKANERGSLMNCSTEDILYESVGLVPGHAYSITGVHYVNGKEALLRLRNPHGQGKKEWNGAWSDRSPNWLSIPEDEKQNIGLTIEKDGEFWMSYKELLKYFDLLFITNLTPDSLTEDEDSASGEKQWKMSQYKGEWVRKFSAGGCHKNTTVFRNSQYRIKLTEVDDDDENTCSVLISLMQKNRRKQRKLGRKLLTIGFQVYSLEDSENPSTPLNKNYFKHNIPVAESDFIPLTEVNARFSLPRGVYCIIPSTDEPDEEGEFLLRVFTEKMNHMEVLDEELGLKDMDDRVIETTQPEPEEKVKEMFLKLAGEDMEVDWMELKKILDYAMRHYNLGKEGLSKEVCRKLIVMLDTDHSSKLDFEEFLQLWLKISQWKAVYELYSKQTEGFMCSSELREALNSAGYRLDHHILNTWARQYADRDGRISFDDFIMCAVKLANMIKRVKDMDPDDRNRAMFTLREWVEDTIN